MEALLYTVSFARISVCDITVWKWGSPVSVVNRVQAG
jgi:hypothetical protein